jgi:hypothetical protein
MMLYGVGRVHVTATADAADVIAAADAPYTAADGGDAWQLDTTVAETANEVVAVAARAGVEASPVPNKLRANATDEYFMDSLFARIALKVNRLCPLHGPPKQRMRESFNCHIGSSRQDSREL